MSEILDKLNETLRVATEAINNLNDYKEELENGKFKLDSERYSEMYLWLKSLQESVVIAGLKSVRIGIFTVGKNYLWVHGLHCTYTLPEHFRKIDTAPIDSGILDYAIRRFEADKEEIEKDFANTIIEYVSKKANSINLQIEELKNNM